jgi:hypothetical protein
VKTPRQEKLATVPLQESVKGEKLHGACDKYVLFFEAASESNRGTADSVMNDEGQRHLSPVKMCASTHGGPTTRLGINESEPNATVSACCFALRPDEARMPETSTASDEVWISYINIY